MTSQGKRDRWLKDIEERQRSTVFPDTVQNEVRFWRNLAEQPWKTSTKVGMLILAVFACAWLGIFLVAARHVLWALVLGMLVLWGPIFAILARATQRNLRKIQKARHGRRYSR